MNEHSVLRANVPDAHGMPAASAPPRVTGDRIALSARSTVAAPPIEGPGVPPGRAIRAGAP